MSRVWPVVVRMLSQQLPTIVVLATLLALGWYGAVHDWKLSEMVPWLARATEEKAKEEPKEAQNPSTEPGDVELATPSSAAEAGIQTDQARRPGDPPIPQVIHAPGVVIFDHDRFSQPAPLVSGTAYRVMGEHGKRVNKGDVLALIASPQAGKLRADFLLAWVQSQVRAAQLERLTSAGSAVPERQVVDARQTLREARLAMMNAHQELENIGIPFSLDSLRGLGDEEVRQKVRLLGVPASMHREAGLPATLVPLVAPIAGQVVRRELAEGETVGPNQTPFAIGNVDLVLLVLDVRQEDADKLASGQKVTFYSTASSQTATGTLGWISPEVDLKTRTVKAHADIYNPTGRLRPATFGKVEIQVASPTGVSVPVGAVQWDGKSHRVFIQRDRKTFEPRLVLPGPNRNNHVELLDPRTLLAAGLPGQVATPAGAWGSLGMAAASNEVFIPVMAGQRVATTGSQALKSEMFKSRIAGSE